MLSEICFTEKSSWQRCEKQCWDEKPNLWELRERDRERERERERERINASGRSYQSVIIQVIKILAGLGNIYQKRISRTW